ncbi:hypothetical protein EDB85DRAFT_1918509 [Lactarius pseudohatsudake]|nr:hypothetical protein EDB85DRAFT_1918509 [Lactarius pseudohatsudake]
MLNLLTTIERCGPDGKTHLSLITVSRAKKPLRLSSTVFILYLIGVNQARTLGESLADTHFTAIYTSDLQRASATAQALYDHQKDPKPSFDSSVLFREQSVGLAVGKPMSFDVISPALSWEEHAARGYTWHVSVTTTDFLGEKAPRIWPSVQGQVSNSSSFPMCGKLLKARLAYMSRSSAMVYALLN